MKEMTNDFYISASYSYHLHQSIHICFATQSICLINMSDAPSTKSNLMYVTTYLSVNLILNWAICLKFPTCFCISQCGCMQLFYLLPAIFNFS